jgi:protein-tyrosine-phosphatase
MRQHAQPSSWLAALERLYSLLKTEGKPGRAARIMEGVLSKIERKAQEKIRETGEAARLVHRDSRLLFLCLGNINRSSVAERQMKLLLGENARILSCGFHPRLNRPADPVMVLVAARNGVSMENWGSRVINREMISQVDLIFAMEAWHLVRLHGEYPDSRGKAFLLNCIRPGPDCIDIADPYAKPPEEYQKCFDIIAMATSTLARLMTGGFPG